MKASFHPALILAFSLALAVSAVSQDLGDHAGDRRELLSLLAKVEKALNARDLEGVKENVHPEAVITFQDAKVVKGLSALDGYFRDKLGGPGAVLKGYATKAEVDAPAIFYGDVAVAHGHTTDRFEFAAGKSFEMVSRWTATVRKDEGRWRVMALHFSANLFDNPLLDAATKNLFMVGLSAFLLGALLCFLAAKLSPWKTKAA